MDSRERVFTALEHREPDRVPVDFWASPATLARLGLSGRESYEEFLNDNDVDFRYIPGPRYRGPALTGPAGETDIWGVPRVAVSVPAAQGGGAGESYREVVSSPLADCASVEEVLAYQQWPSADWFDYREIEAQCEAVREQARVVIFMGDRLNRLAQLKPAMYLRGTERILMDLLDSPEIARAIFDRIARFYQEYGRRILEAARGKIDILCTGDDFGAQQGLLVSPQAWAELLRPGFQGYLELGHAFGARVMHHSCGAVAELIPQMIDCGLDILQSLQPEAAGMEPTFLKGRFGASLAFQGGISIQEVLPRADAAGVRRHVREVMAALAPGGGYIACTSHNIQADTPPANVQALLVAYREFGRHR